MHSERHRSTFATVIGIVLPILALLWFHGDLGPYEYYGYPPLALYLAWVLWALLRERASMHLLIRVTYWILVAFWLGLMAFRLFVDPEPPPGVQRLGPAVYMVFIVLSIAPHLLFATRTALKASASILIASAAINFTWIGTRVGVDGFTPLLTRLVGYQGLLAIAILMLYALAKSKDDHAEALVEAERLRGMAYRDTLTGLPNRRRLEEDLEHHLSLAERHDQPLSVILFDIDRFKKINDTYGHHVGDQMLGALGGHVRPLLRAADRFGRWGGEEFMIIAPATGHGEAMALGERIRRAIEQHEGPDSVPVTASFGVATRSGGASTVADLLKRADARLYEAKRAGRNRVAGGRTAAEAGATVEPSR